MSVWSASQAVAVPSEPQSDIGRLLKRVVADQPFAVAEPESSPHEMLARLFHGRRVLVADDDPVNLAVETFLLEEVGLVPDIANNGNDALEKARRGAYALILMDVQMPVMDGLEATRAIRQLPNMADTPILAMTANAFDEDRDQCLAAGMNAHIDQPVEADTFYTTVLLWLLNTTDPAPI